MNINDVKEDFKIPDSPDQIWKDIFEKQMALAVKYKDIENMGDLLDTTDNNVDTAKGQKWIKDFSWRVTEEIAEAFEAKNIMDSELFKRDEADFTLVEETQQHFKEELADALHFLVELTIIAGYDYKIPAENKTYNTNPTPWKTIYNLGLMCNTLKNKPWKQTQMLTDRKEFEKYLKLVWSEFISLCNMYIGTLNSIYTYYFKKQEVNKFRQRSKY